MSFKYIKSKLKCVYNETLNYLFIYYFVYFKILSKIKIKSKLKYIFWSKIICFRFTVNMKLWKIYKQFIYLIHIF